jgi:hypothetical protein
LPKGDQIGNEGLNIGINQSKHPLILDLNERNREIYITNVTHSSYYKGKLEKIGNDENERDVHLIKFNKILKVTNDSEGKEVLKELNEVVEQTKEKDPVKNMDYFSEKVGKQAEKQEMKFNSNQESKTDFSLRVQEMIKNTKD